MKSLIGECVVFNWVIDKYREQNKQNPCALCEYATENCLDYLSRGYVPFTGEKIEGIKEIEEIEKSEEIEEIKEENLEVTDDEPNVIIEDTDTDEQITEKPLDITSSNTPKLPSCKKNLLPRKKKKRKKR